MASVFPAPKLARSLSVPAFCPHSAGTLYLGLDCFRMPASAPGLQFVPATAAITGQHGKKRPQTWEGWGLSSDFDVVKAP